MQGTEIGGLSKLQPGRHWAVVAASSRRWVALSSRGTLLTGCATGLKDLQLVSYGGWSTTLDSERPLFALTLLHLLGTDTHPYPPHLLTLIIQSSLKTLKHLTVSSPVTENPAFVAHFPALAPQLTSLRLVLLPSLSILHLFPLLTKLRSIECDYAWRGPVAHATSVLLALASAKIPIEELIVGHFARTSNVDKHIILARIMEAVITQKFSKLKTVAFATVAKGDGCPALRRLEELCGKQEMAVEWWK